ncbi:MAG: hypothetical protein GX929_03480 [Clostridiales bacterium]|jgi:LmbE family N-acetylglucosaminyl deacetylase|nr:hypothetical protein [Clostridiales bacterium]
MRILAIGCHPDDLEIACGGTLAKYAKRGDTVIMCHIANGNMGHAVIMPDELGKIRAKEAQEAGKILGAEEVINIDVGDLYVSRYNEDTQLKVCEVVRYARPDIIITHDTEDYMRDHRETSATTFNASFSTSIVHYVTKSAPFEGNSCPIFYMDNLGGVNFTPTHYVDITDTIEIKLRALEAHESQIKWMLEHDHIDFCDMVRTCSKFRGIQCGVPYAEGFRPCLTWPRISTKHLLP